MAPSWSSTPVRTLLLPIAGPWLKAAEMIDYFRAVAPARGYAIHDAILNDNGLGVMTRMMSLAAAPSGAPVARQYPAPAWSCDPGQWNVTDIIQSPERFYPSRVPELLPPGSWPRKKSISPSSIVTNLNIKTPSDPRVHSRNY